MEATSRTGMTWGGVRNCLELEFRRHMLLVRPPLMLCLLWAYLKPMTTISLRTCGIRCGSRSARIDTRRER